ncbi:MAG TPA: HYExAFE family protein [Phycisphaerae bacterium]|nr:HYExAFE family protein [Phycisphaerae bacterium]
MAIRRSHYEMAFEAYLARRGTPCVAIEDVKHFAKSKAGAKIFDYIVYPSGGPACLVDVKGRKTSRAAADDAVQTKSWVTRGDLDGLQAWLDVFGSEYIAMFAFAYWLVGDEPLFAAEDDATFVFAGRRYSFRLVSLADYLMHHRNRSSKWDTVWVPADPFRSICRRLEASWPAAPC